MLQFFEYYSSFDFNSRAISLNEAAVISKPEHSALYIVNPLERALNVSKNVSIEELERLRIELRNAAWTMEVQEDGRRKAGNWGVLALFTNHYKTNRVGFYATSTSTTPLRYNSSGSGGRMMEVSKLFEEPEPEPEMDNGTNTNTSTGVLVEYKNDSIRKQVANIKKETQERIQDMERTSIKNKDGVKRRTSQPGNIRRNTR